MGRTIVTLEEAAKMLQCTKRTIHNHIKRGLLRRTYQNDKVMLFEDEVKQIMYEDGTSLPPLNNRTLLEILAKLRELEIQMAVFKKMNGIETAPPLRPNEKEAKDLLSNVRRYLKKERFEFEEVSLWVSLFMRMDEITFQTFLDSKLPDDFWQDIFNLCLHLIQYVSRLQSTPSVNWYGLYLELNECKKNLRSLILLWIEIGKGRTSASFRKALGTEKDELISRLLSSG